MGCREADEEHTKVCDESDEPEGPRIYPRKPKPDGKGFMEQKKRDTPKMGGSILCM